MKKWIWVVILVAVSGLAGVGVQGAEDKEAAFAKGVTLFGSPDKKAEQEGLAIIEKLGNENQVSAMLYLGWIYYVGEGVKQDYKTSFNWFDKAAKKNHPEAKVIQGIMYLCGLGTEVNIKRAYELWNDAYKTNQHPGARMLISGSKGEYALYTNLMVSMSGLVRGKFSEATTKLSEWLHKNETEAKKYLIEDDFSEGQINSSIAWLKNNSSVGYNFAYAYLGLFLMQASVKYDNPQEADAAMELFAELEKTKEREGLNVSTLPVIDSSTDEKFEQSGKEVFASVKADLKEEYNRLWNFFEDFYMVHKEFIPKFKEFYDGKNFLDVLDVMRANLKEMIDSTKRRNMKIRDSLIEIATQDKELNKIVLTNYKYDAKNKTLELDVENKTNQEITGIKIMIHPDFKDSSKRSNFYAPLEFKLLKPNQKVHAKEKITIDIIAETFESMPSTGLKAVALQAYDKDHRVVLDNEEFTEAMDQFELNNQKIEFFTQVLNPRARE